MKSIWKGTWSLFVVSQNAANQTISSLT